MKQNIEIWRDNEGSPCYSPEKTVNNFQEARTWLLDQDDNWQIFTVHYNGQRISAESFISESDINPDYSQFFMNKKNF